MDAQNQPLVQKQNQFTYRDYLQKEFQIRTRRNPAYSLRAYARDIGMQPSKLSEVLRHACGLGEAMAAQVAKKLRLSEIETQHFITLVEAEHARSHTKKKMAQELLKKFQQNYGYDELDFERFKIISDWYHFAILELTDVQDFQSNSQWISQRLGVAIFEVEKAISRLLEFGLLKTNAEGKLIQTNEHMATPHGVPNRELQEHHRQIMEKGIESIDKYNINERDLSAVTLSISEEQIPIVKKMILEFRRSLSVKVQEQNPKDRVYNLAIQFFPLDNKGREEPSPLKRDGL